jgi:hypothetical protein
VLLALLGVALIMAAFRGDVPMLSGGNPNTWNGWVHGIAFLLIISGGGYWALRCFPSLALGNATFLMAILTLFAWIAAVAVRLATHHP